jgi:hypothetical protein
MCLEGDVAIASAAAATAGNEVTRFAPTSVALSSTKCYRAEMSFDHKKKTKMMMMMMTGETRRKLGRGKDRRPASTGGAESTLAS